MDKIRVVDWGGGLGFGYGWKGWVEPERAGGGGARVEVSLGANGAIEVGSRAGFSGVKSWSEQVMDGVLMTMKRREQWMMGEGGSG